MNCRTSTKRKAIRSSKYIAKQKEVVHNLIPLPMEYAKKKKKREIVFIAWHLYCPMIILYIANNLTSKMYAEGTLRLPILNLKSYEMQEQILPLQS